MVELRISAVKDELEQMLSILKASKGVEIISISKDYPNRGFDSRVRCYLKCEIKKSEQPIAESSFFDSVANIGNTEVETLEYMKEVLVNEPDVLDEAFFSTFCCNCQYLSKAEGANFFCQHCWREIDNVEVFVKNMCPIYNNLIKGRDKKCL